MIQTHFKRTVMFRYAHILRPLKADRASYEGDLIAGPRKRG